MIKELCVANTWFKKQTKGKSLIVPVDVEQKLILCLWGKIQKVYQGCKGDFMGTSAQDGGRRSR